MLKPIKSVSKMILAATLMGSMAWTMPVNAAPVPAAAVPSSTTASGIVLDEFGDPAIGASVKVANNPTQGAATNMDGEFSITNVKPGTKLIITSIGYKNSEVVWNGEPLEIQLELNSKALDEVVVTAMGIKREEKTLTYAVQTIKNDEVTRIKETNFVNALQGKSAGLTITPNNSGAGGGASRIVLRGSTSILGSNQPLIVIDGVPMTNGMGTQATDGIDMGGGKSGDDLLSTINPEDIENMTVLKGPNAAALYGAAANNGVIVITTKSGAQGTVNVNISSSTSIDRIAMYPRQQQWYGITNTGNGHSAWSAWGPRVGTRSADEVAAYPWLSNTARNSVPDYFQTGVTLNNGITLSGGTELSRTYFSYNNTYQDGIIPGNKFTRNNVMLKESFSLFDKKVNITASLNWIHQRTDNSPVVGKALSGLYALYRTPADVDMRYYKNNYAHLGQTGEYLVSDPSVGNPKLVGQPIQTWDWFVDYLNNPWWVQNMVNDQIKRDRILGNITLDWTIWKNLKYQTRFSVDMVMDNSLNEEYATMFRAGFDYKGGKYYSNNSRTSDIYNDHMLTWNDRFNDKIDVNVALGGSFTRHYSRSTTIQTGIDTSGVPNAFVPQNNKYYRPSNPNGSATSASDSWDYTDWSSALFGTVSLGFLDKIYVDGSYRRDWCQAFQQFTAKGDYKSFGYYSFGANVLIDKFFNQDYKAAPWLDQLKWRGSYSVVGNSVPNTLFARQSLNFSTGALSTKPPTFDDPKPETTTAFETGIDAWMFNNKFNIDLTYYNSTLRNQFLYVSTANGESKPVNTGKIRNTGIEISMGYRWAINSDWQWQSNVNFAYNDNKIIETYMQDNGLPYIYETGPKAFHIKYLEGGKFGDIYVNSFARDENGHIQISGVNEDGTIDYANAVPRMASGQYETYVGNTTSPYTLGWSNTLTWKNWTLYFLIDGRIGGKVMSLTEPDLDRFGISTNSGKARLAAEADPDNLMAYAADGTPIHLMYLPDGSGRKISVQKYYETIGQNPMEEHVYNATNFRMRDIALSYTLPNLFGKSKGMTAQFSVKNAFFLYKDSPVDPDISVSAANGYSGIDSYALPTLRSYCITLKFNF
ncbi:MAG: SusC/RagA family TonB-linked outer membrane protein [Bacteroides sp.]|nr:SusC/RagA family TonB-linked outer membrane protein [Bacteroides sp.]MCM1413550.1 SusC/RagA family TonB-linked outer membrane protein [Bacteroides sp.]MCM1471104.1 SusC/RagA family TonB-linked outer membrane protein [Bacteroides sp.]